MTDSRDAAKSAKCYFYVSRAARPVRS